MSLHGSLSHGFRVSWECLSSAVAERRGGLFICTIDLGFVSRQFRNGGGRAGLAYVRTESKILILGNKIRVSLFNMSAGHCDAHCNWTPGCLISLTSDLAKGNSTGLLA
jgi:hypothetical protein